MKKISIYQVEETPIGSGGMGRVLRGSDPDGRPVAIKEILPEFANDFEIRTRTEREVQILEALNQTDGVVKVYDRFPMGNNFYIVMELIDGLNIEQYIQKYGAMPHVRAIRFMMEILETMQTVHEKEIVHRDMKPSNIMIRTDEHTCILDFGIAKDMNAQNQVTTIIGTIIGSDGYMSPEQADGYSIDHRADIYALGCVLYYMLTGHHAFDTLKSDYETRENIINKPFPRLKKHSKTDFPKGLQEVLDRATDKNMMRRYQTCSEFRKDLEKVLKPERRTYVSRNQTDDIKVTVGREDCDIIIGNDEQLRVSRQHLDIIYKEFTGGRYYVVTDHSSNGTYVNGSDLKHGESINIPTEGATPVIYLARDMNYPLDWEQVRTLIAERLKVQETNNSDDASGKTIYPDPGPIPQTLHESNNDNETFIGCVKLFFTRAFDFRGRSRRREYWWFMLFNLIACFVIGFTGGLLQWSEEDITLAIYAYYFVLFIPFLSLSIRRLHDIDKAWYYILINFIPFGGFVFLFWTCTDSYPLENEWGPCPKD